MSNPAKRTTRYVYLLNPAREPEQEAMIYVPVDVWRDLLVMTGIGLFFGVGKGSNIDATGEVLSPLGAKDKRGLPLVERGPRNIQPSPDQAQATSEPYPGIGLQQTRYGVDSVVAISKGEAEVIGKMLRVWAHLETSRAAMLCGGKTLNATRKRRHANEDEIEVGRAAQWTVPPHENWRKVAEQLGAWLCVRTSAGADVYISMNPDALDQAVRRDLAAPAVFGEYPARIDRRRADEGFGAPPADPPPSPAAEALLTRLRAELPGDWSDGGARGALLWIFPFAIAVSAASVSARSLTVTAEHLRDVNRRRLGLGWGALRDVLADLVAETVCQRLWIGNATDLGPSWARVEVCKALVKLREQLTRGNSADTSTTTRMVESVDRLLDLGLTKTDAEAQ